MARIKYSDEFVLKVRAANKTMTAKQLMKKFKLTEGQLDYALYKYEMELQKIREIMDDWKSKPKVSKPKVSKPKVAKVEVLPPEKEVKKISVTERYNPQPLSIYGRLKRDLKWLFGFGKG